MTMTMKMNMIMVKFYSSMAAQPHHLDIGDEYDGDKMLTLHVSISWCLVSPNSTNIDLDLAQSTQSLGPPSSPYCVPGRQNNVYLAVKI